MRSRHVDLCSGIGGFALAAGWAGYDTIAFSEIDPFCCEVLKKHWPKVRNYGDIRTIPVIGCELVTAGFPCQPYSCAGRRGGASDHRHLWPAVRNVLEASRPDDFVGENVTGIISMELESVCTDLENLGYTVQTFIIPACAVNAFQHRERVWICAHAERQGFPRRKQNNGTLSRPSETYPKPHYGMPTSWDALARHSRGLRGGDGLSVSMVRNEVKAYGNAIVPQVAYQILNAMAEQWGSL